jgi:glycosyltransferase involved in cell wall biosynthesis
MSTACAPVSTIIPCYRCVDTIDAAVASVAAQRLRPAEVLLVDDGSHDGTPEYLHAVARRHEPGWIRVLASDVNAGPAAARNRAWRHAAQPFIAFLDADDTWHPQKLAVQMAVMGDQPDIALLAHRMNVQRRGERPPPQRYPLKVRTVSPHLLQWRSPFQTPSILLGRDLPFRFNENFRRSEDFLLWAQILLSGYRCAKIEHVLGSLHKPAFGASGLSGDLRAMYAAGRRARAELHRGGFLGWWHYCAADLLADMRYARRRVITHLRESGRRDTSSARRVAP